MSEEKKEVSALEMFHILRGLLLEGSFQGKLYPDLGKAFYFVENLIKAEESRLKDGEG